MRYVSILKRGQSRGIDFINDFSCINWHIRYVGDASTYLARNLEWYTTY
jgi:hypothetical protein